MLPVLPRQQSLESKSRKSRLNSEAKLIYCPQICNMITPALKHAPGIVMYSLHPTPRGFMQGKQKERQTHICHPEERCVGFVPNRTRELFSSSLCNGKNWCAALPKAGAFISALSARVLEFLLHVFNTWLFWDVTKGCQHLFSSPRLQLCRRSYCPQHTPALSTPSASCEDAPAAPVTVSQIGKILIYWE